MLKAMQKVRYEVDPHNRLVVEEAGRKTKLTRFRKVLDGQFKVDGDNELSYHIKAPLQKDMTIPHQINIKGRWSLTDDHDLMLTLDKVGRETFGEQIVLRGEIINVNENSLLFSITRKTKENIQSTYILNFQGAWQADESNRLIFHIKKEKGTYDILTLNGTWDINKHHQIIYQYEKSRLIRKKKKIHTLTFKGYWEILDKARISYVLDKDTDSLFNFRTSAGIFEDDYIKFEIGVDLARRTKPVMKTITLFGNWRLKRGTGLIFEVEYDDRKIFAIVFGLEATLTDKDTILFRLKNEMANKDLGINLELSHKILKGDGEAFLRLLKSKQESAILAGTAWRW